MPALVDLTGQRFGRLLVIERAGSGNGHAMWRVRCDCSQERITQAGSLRSGQSRSCGCLNQEVRIRLAPLRGRTHGMTGHPEWYSWRAMKDRCYWPAHASFANYGLRGITVCAEWRHDFAAFFAHVGPRPGPGFSLDRIDPDLGYQPGNVRWSTLKEQRANRRRKVLVTSNSTG